MKEAETRADQAYNAFSAFSEDALVRIDPESIRKKGKVPKNGSIFFTIFQTFMASASSATDGNWDRSTDSSTEDVFPELTNIPDANGEGSKHTQQRRPVKLVYCECFGRIDAAFSREKQVQNWSRAKKIALIKGDVALLKRLSKSRSVPEPVEGYFGDYPAEFFDFIVIDECHRGGANDESNWRAILDYFAPAVQLGLTATPTRKDNVDTYAYFGDPVYIYSLKEGIAPS